MNWTEEGIETTAVTTDLHGGDAPGRITIYIIASGIT
jgi:hypothetical protein